MKLGSPYSNSGNHNRNNSKKRSGGHGQSYVWKVTVYEKRFLLPDAFYKSEIFTNKVAAIQYQNNWNNKKGFYAVVAKHDPTKR